MKQIGIIVAMQEEQNAIEKVMKKSEEKEIKGIKFKLGKIDKKDCILVQCGVGKVNAARVTQMLMDYFEIEYVINLGSAGALEPNLDIGDIVIGEKLIQHDFDITAFGHPKGYITDIGHEISSNLQLIERFEKTITKLANAEYKIQKGIIASGDIFCTEMKMKEKIHHKFNAKCVEMEGAAIAQVCYLNQVPFLVIRSISDSPNGNNAITFDQYLELASKRCALFLKEALKD